MDKTILIFIFFYEHTIVEIGVEHAVGLLNYVQIIPWTQETYYFASIEGKKWLIKYNQ